jgi:hypothetical protein
MARGTRGILPRQDMMTYFLICDLIVRIMFIHSRLFTYEVAILLSILIF